MSETQKTGFLASRPNFNTGIERGLAKYMLTSCKRLYLLKFKTVNGKTYYVAAQNHALPERINTLMPR